MRDELEALLEDEEALEAELASILSARVVTYRRKNRQQPEQETVGGQNAAEQMTGKETVFSGETTTAGELNAAFEAGKLPAEWAERRIQALSVKKTMPKTETVSQEQGMTLISSLPASESLYVGLAKTRQAARYRRPSGGQKIRLEKEPAAGRSAGLDAAGLDQLFRRDARRYDGGFTWQ